MKRKVVKHLSRVVDGRRQHYGEELECGHVWHYARRPKRPRKWRTWRSCAECAGKPLALRGTETLQAQTQRAQPRLAGDPQVAVLRAALRRLIESTRTSPAPAAVQRFCMEALGRERSEEALLHLENLQRLGEVVVEFLNGHPFGERAMACREEMARLCQVLGLLPWTPEANGDVAPPRNFAMPRRED